MIEADTVNANSTIQLLESLEAPYPRFPGQRALSSRQAREGMAVPTGMRDQTAYLARLLPASEPDRAVPGRHAQERHAQQMPRHPRRVRRGRATFSPRGGPEELGGIPKCSHRQFSNYLPQGVSAPGMNRVYIVRRPNHGAGLVAGPNSAPLVKRPGIPINKPRLSDFCFFTKTSLSGANIE